MKPDLLIREDLYKLVSRGGRIAELGVDNGYNAAALLWICQPSELCLIDGWIAFPEFGKDFDADEQQAKYEFVCRSATERCRVIRARTHEAVTRFPDEYFDFVYIDASHRYEDVRQDIEDWWPKVKTGGMLAGHDYLNQVKRAVNERFPVLDHLSSEHCGSWAVVKTNGTP
jgi:predicted O-methyltransferase YrrM